MDLKTISALAKARLNHDAAYAVLKALEADFKSVDVWKAADKALEEASAALNAADEAFRTEALASFEVDQEKHTDSYDIRDDTTVTIPDEAAAIHWSITNFTPGLALNKKIFVTAVKAGSIPAELAVVETKPKVFVKSDLSKFA